MLGAIVGDIVGSPYEFDENAIKSTQFPLFTDRSHATDDTVMTLAVGEALLAADGDEEIADQALIDSMREYGERYPTAGYGGRFSFWLRMVRPIPYNSFGNGSAMRVSTVGWLFESIEDVERWAQITARVTHNHPEGIKGAQATAVAILLARQGRNKGEIAGYIEGRFGYDLNRTCDEIRADYHHVESCQETVPQAIVAFLESDGFEDALRLAVSLGGDADTLAAITGSIAEGAYGIPHDIEVEALARLDLFQHEALERIDRARGH